MKIKRLFAYILVSWPLSISVTTLAACSGPDDPLPETGGGGNNQTPGDNNGSGDHGNPGDSGSTTTGDVIFYDDFEGESTVPDTTKWVLCQRAESNWARYLSESYEQAYQQDGYLNLVAEEVDGQYQTGGIETRGKFDFEYGTVECRARFLRQPAGNHTGIWMMPAPPAEKWPKSGEIDIMEHLGDDKIVYETVHSWYLDDMGKTEPKGQGTVAIDNEEWNTYGVKWTPDSITYTVNGTPYLSYPNLHLADAQNAAYQWPFNHSFYIILSQSLGGTGTWAGPVDNSALPAVFQIDWIKVTQ